MQWRGQPTASLQPATDAALQCCTATQRSGQGYREGGCLAGYRAGCTHYTQCGWRGSGGGQEAPIRENGLTTTSKAQASYDYGLTESSALP